jgi:CheY-like chemotaxis protein
MPNENPAVPYDVLIVEDNTDDLDLLLRVFRQVQSDIGIEINARAVSNSVQAAAQLDEHKFDAIFLDIEMAPPNGLELAKRTRNSETNRTTPIVIVTGGEDRGLMTRAFQAGANFFLFKPINRVRLLRLIQISSVPIERERRRLQRVRVKCKVSIESEQGHFDGETLDLSLSGMLVRASRVLPVGSTVGVTLRLPSATAPIRTAARVVRVVGNEFMAFQLQNMSKAESDKLGEFLVPLIVSSTE